MHKAGFIESWGKGISKITDGFAAAGLKAPEFKEDCGGMLVTLYRNTDLANGLSSVESSKNTEENERSFERSLKEVLKAVLSDREYESMKSIINYLENNSSITTGIAMKLSGKSSTTAW